MFADSKLNTNFTKLITLSFIMSFEAYLISKKIDPANFQTREPVLFNEWQLSFEQTHPDSFTAQKKFLINPLRRKYLLK